MNVHMVNMQMKRIINALIVHKVAWIVQTIKIVDYVIQDIKRRVRFALLFNVSHHALNVEVQAKLVLSVVIYI